MDSGSELTEVKRWWERVRRTAPVGLGGMWFGLTGLAEGGWHLYVAGTEEFDPDDETAEWAVGPYAWWPDNRYFPFREAGELDVDAAVAAAARLVRSFEPWQSVLVRGVAVGFDDGDFAIVYPAAR